MFRYSTFVLLYTLLLLQLLSVESLESGLDHTEQCRTAGFDPVQLACNTCKLLSGTPSLHETCLDCCQTYMDVERITKPFQSAVLVQMTSVLPTEGDLADFFRDDWIKLQQTKSTRLVKIIDESTSSLNGRNMKAQMLGGQNNIFQFLSGFGRQTAEILFLDEPLPPKNMLSYDKLSELAKETVQLDGMKRDDIKDMITTLLP